MRIGRNEIIAKLTEHMRNLGGEPGEWCVGTAGDRALDGKLPLQSTGETSPRLPGLAYREAHTPYVAADAADYLVSAFGLRPARGSTPQARQNRLRVPAGRGARRAEGFGVSCNGDIKSLKYPES
jgi:hypothetical protein